MISWYFTPDSFQNVALAYVILSRRTWVIRISRVICVPDTVLGLWEEKIKGASLLSGEMWICSPQEFPRHDQR